MPSRRATTLVFGTVALLVLLCLQLYGMQWVLRGGIVHEMASFTDIQFIDTSEGKSTEPFTVKVEIDYPSTPPNAKQKQSWRVCQRLPAGVSASAIWRQHEHLIVNSTALLPSHIPWMKRLWTTLTPSILEKGLLVIPLERDVDAVFKILDITNRTLRIAVMGGSVPEGRGCEIIPSELKEYNTHEKVENRECSWVHRLQMLIDGIAGETIQIYNLATGGTHSDLAVPIMEYGLYHSKELRETGGPDIFINAFGTNDALYSWSWNTTVNNATANYDHYRKTLKSATNFGNAALSSKPCLNPVVIFVNEYFGNHHDRLLGEDIRNTAIRDLSKHTGWMYVNSAFALRPFVYVNTNETLFSPKWYKRRKKRMERRRDGHFGMPGHIAVAWVVAYSFLQVAVEYCEKQRSMTWAYQQRDWGSVVSVSAMELYSSNRPIPPVSWNTTPDAVSQQWRDNKLRLDKDTVCTANGGREPCVFAFLANPAGTHRQANVLAAYVRRFQTENIGWKAENDMQNGWQNKLGLCAHNVGDHVVLHFADIANRVRFVMLQSLKSYGEKWDGSEARFDIAVRGQQVEHDFSFNIKGFHGENNSITYSHSLDFGEDKAAEIGSNLTLTCTLTGGANFKITALMLCSR